MLGHLRRQAFAAPGHCRVVRRVCPFTGQPHQGRPPGSARGGPGCFSYGSVPRERGQFKPVPFIVLLCEGPMRPAPSLPGCASHRTPRGPASPAGLTPSHCPGRVCSCKSLRRASPACQGRPPGSARGGPECPASASRGLVAKARVVRRAGMPDCWVTVPHESRSKPPLIGGFGG